MHAVLFQGVCQVQRCLSAELRDHAQRLFLLINTQYIFQCQRFEVQLVGCIIIGGNRLRITVYDDGLKSQILQRQRRVNTAVVKFDTLTDTVRTAAQNHDLFLIITGFCMIRRIVSGVVISAVFGTAYMHAFPCFFHAIGNSGFTHSVFRYFQQLA